VSHDDKDDQKLAGEALTQIRETNYGGYLNPVLFGLVVNDNARSVTAWKCEGGHLDNPVLDEERGCASVGTKAFLNLG
jgi:hypothetical protein